jgi:hypothetical protein
VALFVRIAEFHKILVLCTGVRNLVCYFGVDPSFIPSLDSIRSLHLCVTPFIYSPDFSHTLFVNITALGLQRRILQESRFDSVPDTHCIELLLLRTRTRAISVYTPRGEEGLELQALILMGDEIFLHDTDNLVSANPMHDVQFIVTICDV